ncbi:MAG: T9SS type A sorting domain-containing protein [Ignavibacteria bacterium]|nr:T9SS type A sorting domain-containing protein [Ignavibacteria bacterium]
MKTKIRFSNKFSFVILLFMVSQLLQAQWVKQNSGTSERLTNVVMLDSSTAIAVGMNQTILKTTNSGETWNYIALPWSFPMNWNCVSFADKLNGVIAGSNVITTTDGGASWEPEFYSYDKNFLSALFVDPGYILVGDDSGFVFQSIDSGKTWSSEKISVYPIRSIFLFRGIYAFGLPLYALTPHSILTKLLFPDTPSWFEKELDFFNGLGSEAYNGESCNGGGSTFLVGVQGDWRAAPVILRKQMSDTSWTRSGLYPDPDGELRGVSAPSSSTIYACGYPGLLYKTIDGGDNWILHSVPTSQSLNSIYSFNDTKGFAVGDSGTILFTSNGGLTDVDEDELSITDKFQLFQNYPNPFNPSTVISYQLAVGSFVTLKVYDVLGNEVATLVNEFMQAATYNQTFNVKTGHASFLPSGIYFYKLQAGSFTQTKKFVLLK